VAIGQFIFPGFWRLLDSFWVFVGISILKKSLSRHYPASILVGPERLLILKLKKMREEKFAVLVKKNGNKKKCQV